MQAHTNYSTSSTGQLSAATGFMLFFGSLARIFTSIQETGDTTMIIMYVCATLANAILVFQFLYYWNVPSQKKKTKSKKKEWWDTFISLGWKISFYHLYTYRLQFLHELLYK